MNKIFIITLLFCTQSIFAQKSENWNIFKKNTLYESDSGFVRDVKLKGRYHGQYISQDEDIDGVKDNEYDVVETQDLLDAINKTWNDNPNLDQPPMDFKWMFDQWIWKAGYPELEVKYEYDEEAKEVLLNVKQVQKVDR